MQEFCEHHLATRHAGAPVDRWLTWRQCGVSEVDFLNYFWERSDFINNFKNRIISKICSYTNQELRSEIGGKWWEEGARTEKFIKTDWREVFSCDSSKPTEGRFSSVAYIETLSVRLSICLYSWERTSSTPSFFLSHLLRLLSPYPPLPAPSPDRSIGRFFINSDRILVYKLCPSLRPSLQPLVFIRERATSTTSFFLSQLPLFLLPFPFLL